MIIILKPAPAKYDFGRGRCEAVDEAVAAVLKKLTGMEGGYILRRHIEALRALGVEVEIEETS